MIAAYAVAKLKDGGAQFTVMSKEETDEVKNKTKAQWGPWATSYEAMAQKTVVRRLFKWLPSSVEMQKAAILDEHSEIGIQDIKAALIYDVPQGALTEHLEYDNEEVNKETGEIKSQADELAKNLG
jgi:recombination protein RecT